MSEESKASYSQILKSSSIMGGAAGITMLFGMVRTKFAAILIGTTGVGLIANFTAIQTMVGTVAGLGIGFSAVRDVAAAVAKNDEEAIGRSVLTLRRVCWVAGLLGLVTTVVLSPLLGQWTFGSDEYTLEIASLGLIILFSLLSGGQTALIQGMRRIGDMGKLTIIGAAVGTILAIAFYYWMGLRGIVPALVLTSAAQLVASWVYARRVPVPQVSMSWGESFREAGSMLRLGIATMWTGLIASIGAYLIVTMITNQISLQAVGIYSAAFALSGIFVKFVLQAMGADYFPRLTGVADDKAAMNRLVNEQTEIGLLLAVPGLLATLSLAPWIIHIFYTREFLPAADLLQWFILGCLGRVISWPLGYVMLALEKSKIYFIAEVSFTVVNLGLIYIGLQLFGLEGVAIAFFVSYLGYILLVFGIAYKLTAFTWAASVKRLFLLFLPIVTLTFVSARQLPVLPATISGILMTSIAALLCLRGLVHRIGPEHRLVRSACRIPGIRVICGAPRVSH